MTPVLGSNPPHALSGSVSFSAVPAAAPGTSVSAANTRSVAGMDADLPLDGRLNAVLQIGEQHVDPDVAWRIPGPLGGISHHQPVDRAQDRGFVGTGIGDDLNTCRQQGRCYPLGRGVL